MAQENNAQEILNSLAQLESSLKQIESARQQVEEVVKSATAINGSLENYTRSLNALTDAVKEFIATAQECKKSDVENTNLRLGELCDKLENKIDKLGQPSSQQFVPAQQPNNEHSLTDIVAVGEMLLPIKAQLDDINSKLEHLPHAASNDNATRLLIEANTKIESVDSKLKEITLTTASQNASKPLNTEDAAISSDALKEFEERLNLISKDVMVMRNSTHSILKNMETQLIDRSSKEGRMSLIIAIGALVVAIAILLKLYGAI